MTSPRLVDAGVLDAIADPLFLVDEGWRFVYVNAAALTFSRKPAVALLGASIWEAFPELVGTTYEEHYRRAMAERRPVEFEARSQARDGGWWFCITATPYPGGLAVQYRNITREHQTLEALRLRAGLLDAVGQAVVAADTRGVVIYWNRAAEQLYGWTAAEAVGRSIKEVTPSELTAAETTALFAGVIRGEPWLGELEVADRAGRRFPVWLSVSKVLDESGQVAAIVGVSSEISERKRAEDAVRRSEQRYRALIEQASDGICVVDMGDGGRITAVNSRFCEMLGYTRDELLTLRVPDVLLPEEMEGTEERLRALQAGRTLLSQRRLRRKDGGVVQVEITSRLVGRDMQAFVRDITDRVRLEDQLRQAQKMEAVGLLAGGVAHDFNNLLTAIRAYGQFVQEAMTEHDPRRADVREILRAADRAAELTRQLLAFSRRQLLRPRVIDLNGVAAEMEPLLRRMIGSDVRVIISADPMLGPVLADPGQIEQVIMNLAVNARDAMPAGGTLHISTANVQIPGGGAAAGDPPSVAPGSYVSLVVSDTGTGMDDATRARIFEPFFTTKELGQGTGLGLATIYGIVKQSEGFIWVHSAPGAGATFEVYLPRVAADLPPTPRAATVAAELPGSETILLVEDADG
ncbi:MAG TPA: PAS domain S-box protein, partial [Gemmatimonadaceae bacterium]|nr:PAS domain S-box protein [Gemmatimonadaceae bacterium]